MSRRSRHEYEPDRRPGKAKVPKAIVGRPFEEGNKAAVGNPGPGRMRPLTQMLISALNEVQTVRNPKTGRMEVQDKTNARAIIDKCIALAIDGDSSMIKEIFDRTEGRPVQAVRVDNPTGADTPSSLPDGRTLQDLSEEELSRMWAAAAPQAGTLAQMEPEGEA